MTEPTPPDGSADAPPPFWRRGPVLLAAGAVVVLGVLAAVLVPLLASDDPYDDLGPTDSPAHRVATALSESMTCDSGPVTDSHSVLACYHQHDDLLEIVFLQSDANGAVAGYTAETHLLTQEAGEEGDGHGHAHGDEDATIGLANEVAKIVTPDEGFDNCGYDYSTPYYCFAEVAAWRSEKVEPIESTGAASRLPSPDEVMQSLADAGWECSPLNCVHGEATAVVQESGTGLGVQLIGAESNDALPAAAGMLLSHVPETDDLKEWANGLTGDLSITVRDRFVSGYVPQAGGGGLLVVEEVAGVIASSI